MTGLPRKSIDTSIANSTTVELETSQIPAGKGRGLKPKIEDKQTQLTLAMVLITVNLTVKELAPAERI